MTSAINLKLKTEIATLKYLKIAPRKVRRVANVIKNLPIIEAEAQLMNQPQRAAKSLLKLLKSAAANAKHNKNLNPESLIVKNIIVEGGRMLKRFMPRAMGRAAQIQKKSSHISITLEESQRPVKKFNIIPPLKKKDEEAKKGPAKQKKVESTRMPEKKTNLFGKIRRLFNRKTG